MTAGVVKVPRGSHFRNPRQNIPQILLVVNGKVCAGLKPREIFDPPRRTGFRFSIQQRQKKEEASGDGRGLVTSACPPWWVSQGNPGEGAARGAPRLTVYTSGEATEVVKGIMETRVMTISGTAQRYRGATTKYWANKDLTFQLSVLYTYISPCVTIGPAGMGAKTSDLQAGSGRSGCHES